MDTTVVNQQADLLSLAERAGAKFRKAGADRWQSACPLHGGDSAQAFDVYYQNGKQQYKCFSHAECNQYGNDAIAFVRVWQNKSFRDAVEFLGGKVDSTYKPQASQKPKERVVQLVPSAEWQEKAWKIVDSASDFLLDDEKGLAGREYFTARGISFGMMNLNLLGYTENCYGRPAIVVPHLLDAKTIVAIKYRYIDGKIMDGKESRYTFEKGGLVRLFGLQNRLNVDDTLLFVEGELNAVSIMQMCPSHVTVLSSGAETVSADTMYMLKKIAPKYKRVIVWMDEQETAESVGKDIRHYNTDILFSKTVDEMKWDANQFLQAGLLDEYLTKRLSVRCSYKEGVK